MALGLSLRAGGDARGRRHVSDLVALAIGLFGIVVAALAFAVLAGANVQWIEIAGFELVGLSYIVAGTIAWLRRPDNLIGPAILVTGITSFIPVFVRVGPCSHLGSFRLRVGYERVRRVSGLHLLPGNGPPEPDLDPDRAGRPRPDTRALSRGEGVDRRRRGV